MSTESEVIQQRINITRASLGEKLTQLEAFGAAAGERIETAADAAEQTIGVVNDAVQTVKKGVVSMRGSYSITKQVEKRPWTMVAGATGLAFVGSWMQHRRSVRHSASQRPEPARPPADPPSAAMHQAHGAVQPEPRPTPRPEPAKPWGGKLGVMFEGEIAQLRGIALGMLFGVLRDVVRDRVSKPVAEHVDGVIDGFTNRMGGKPVNGRILPDRKQPDSAPDTDQPNTAGAPET